MPTPTSARPPQPEPTPITATTAPTNDGAADVGTPPGDGVTCVAYACAASAAAWRDGGDAAAPTAITRASTAALGAATGDGGSPATVAHTAAQVAPTSTSKVIARVQVKRSRAAPAPPESVALTAHATPPAAAAAGSSTRRAATAASAAPSEVAFPQTASSPHHKAGGAGTVALGDGDASALLIDVAIHNELHEPLEDGDGASEPRAVAAGRDAVCDAAGVVDAEIVRDVDADLIGSAGIDDDDGTITDGEVVVTSGLLDGGKLTSTALAVAVDDKLGVEEVECVPTELNDSGGVTVDECVIVLLGVGDADRVPVGNAIDLTAVALALIDAGPELDIAALGVL